VSPKTPTFYFFKITLSKINRFSDFWHVKSWENLTWKSYTFVHLPVRCSHFTLIIYVISDYLCYIRRKQTAVHLPTPPENVTTLTCELQHFLIWLKVCCVLSNVGGSKKSQLWVVVGYSGKNRLWCVATGMSGNQCHSKCWEWPPSALIHASSLFRHRSVAYYTTLCWNSAHAATTSRCRKLQHVRINTRAAPVACPRRSTICLCRS